MLLARQSVSSLNWMDGGRTVSAAVLRVESREKGKQVKVNLHLSSVGGGRELHWLAAETLGRHARRQWTKTRR